MTLGDAIREGSQRFQVSHHGAALIVVQSATVLAVGMDGGIRRGTDIVKAICLGARAVCVDEPMRTAWQRPVSWVARAIEILRTDWSVPSGCSVAIHRRARPFVRECRQKLGSGLIPATLPPAPAPIANYVARPGRQSALRVRQTGRSSFALRIGPKPVLAIRHALATQSPTDTLLT